MVESFFFLTEIFILGFHAVNFFSPYFCEGSLVDYFSAFYTPHPMVGVREIESAYLCG